MSSISAANVYQILYGSEGAGNSIAVSLAVGNKYIGSSWVTVTVHLIMRASQPISAIIDSKTHKSKLKMII